MCWWEGIFAGLSSNLGLRLGLPAVLGQVGCVFTLETPMSYAHNDASSREEKGPDKALL